MPDKCPKCGEGTEAGDVKCPACGVQLPEPADPPAPQKAAVLAAAMLPLIFLFVFLLFIGGIVFAAVKVLHVLNKSSANATPADIAPPPEPPPAPVMDAPIPPVVPVPTPPTPVIKPDMPPTAPVASPPQMVQVPPPLLEDFVPPIVPQGSPLVIRGENLKAVDHLLMMSSQGASTVEAKILITTDEQVIVTVPDVPFANDGIFIAAISPGGVAVLVDQHTGNTPWGTDGHLHDTAVNVRSGDEIETHDGMILTAEEGTAVSVGDNSIAFLDKNVTLKGHGKNCRIYYVGPLELGPGVSREGLIEVPSVRVKASVDAFRVKPAPADTNQ